VHQCKSRLQDERMVRLDVVNSLIIELKDDLPNGTLTFVLPKRSKYASPAARITSLVSLFSNGIASERVPIRCSSSVEQPVAGIADQRFDFLDVQAITFDSDAEDVSLIVSTEYFT
jgi:hypothetical protein